jgi:hypothetical protein
VHVLERHGVMAEDQDEVSRQGAASRGQRYPDSQAENRAAPSSDEPETDRAETDTISGLPPVARLGLVGLPFGSRIGPARADTVRIEIEADRAMVFGVSLD